MSCCWTPVRAKVTCGSLAAPTQTPCGQRTPLTHLAKCCLRAAGGIMIWTPKKATLGLSSTPQRGTGAASPSTEPLTQLPITSHWSGCNPAKLHARSGQVMLNMESCTVHLITSRWSYGCVELNKHVSHCNCCGFALHRYGLEAGKTTRTEYRLIHITHRKLYEI